MNITLAGESFSLRKFLLIFAFMDQIYFYWICINALTHWGGMTCICIGKLTIIGSDNGLAPTRRQAINWTNAGILFIGILETTLCELSSEIHTFSIKKMHLKMSFAKWRQFCLNVFVLDLFSLLFTPKTHLQSPDELPMIWYALIPMWRQI